VIYNKSHLEGHYDRLTLHFGLKMLCLSQAYGNTSTKELD